jgi:hypothetical protein
VKRVVNCGDHEIPLVDARGEGPRCHCRSDALRTGRLPFPGTRRYLTVQTIGNQNRPATADVTVSNQDTITDNATFTNPRPSALGNASLSSTEGW